MSEFIATFLQAFVGVSIGYAVCWFARVRPLEKIVREHVAEMRAILEPPPPDPPRPPPPPMTESRG